jgi:hypothetical protein
MTDARIDKESDKILDELETEGAPPEESSEEDLLKKYDQGQAQIITQRNDFLVPNVLQMVRNRKVLNLAPKYQRRKRWNNTKKSHLIESLLMNIPIPPIFLYEIDLAKYEVMDGQQRLDAIRGYFDDEFPLEDLTKWPELNGKYHKDLPTRIQAGLARRGLSAVIILTESGQDPAEALEIRQYVFERLNTGGEKLNAQEVRNCIYASKFNDTLVEIARSQPFTEAWGIPPKEPKEPHSTSPELARNRLYASMADCEIVLRYFALSDLSKFAGGMKHTLDACMQRMQRASKDECDNLKGEYLSVLKTARAVYGASLFKLPKGKKLLGRRSVPLSDAVLLGIRSLGTNAHKLKDKKLDVLRATEKLLAGRTTYEVLVGRPNTKTAIEKRLKLLDRKLKQILKA